MVDVSGCDVWQELRRTYLCRRRPERRSGGSEIPKHSSYRRHAYEGTEFSLFGAHSLPTPLPLLRVDLPSPMRLNPATVEEGSDASEKELGITYHGYTSTMLGKSKKIYSLHAEPFSKAWF